MSILDTSEKEKNHKIKKIRQKICIYFVFPCCGQTFSLYTLLTCGARYGCWVPVGWNDGCMMHMRKTYMQIRMVCYAVLCKLNIYLFLKMKKKHGKLFHFLFGIYVYFHRANIIYSSRTILFVNGVVVLR